MAGLRICAALLNFSGVFWSHEKCIEFYGKSKVSSFQSLFFFSDYFGRLFRMRMRMLMKIIFPFSHPGCFFLSADDLDLASTSWKASVSRTFGSSAGRGYFAVAKWTLHERPLKIRSHQFECQKYWWIICIGGLYCWFWVDHKAL